MFGGGMRQAGVIAAAGCYALEQGIKRLADDHALARRLGDGLRAAPGVELIREPETNMVIFSVADVGRFLAGARERGLLLGAIGAGTVRAVTHLDVDAAGIDRALLIIRELCS
jgi:threonine aldolase